MSYVQSIYHVVFRTYSSEKTISESAERDFYKYAYTVAVAQGAYVYRIGGMPDHVHLLVSIPPAISIADFVQHLKSTTSKWMNGNPLFPHFRGWAKEYAAISYSMRDVEVITNYIKNQKVHHQTQTFAEEYRAFLTECGISINEAYWLKD